MYSLCSFFLGQDSRHNYYSVGVSINTRDHSHQTSPFIKCCSVSLISDSNNTSTHFLSLRTTLEDNPWGKPAPAYPSQQRELHHDQNTLLPRCPSSSNMLSFHSPSVFIDHLGSLLWLEPQYTSLPLRISYCGLLINLHGHLTPATRSYLYQGNDWLSELYKFNVGWWSIRKPKHN